MTTCLECEEDKTCRFTITDDAGVSSDICDNCLTEITGKNIRWFTQ